MEQNPSAGCTDCQDQTGESTGRGPALTDTPPGTHTEQAGEWIVWSQLHADEWQDCGRFNTYNEALTYYTTFVPSEAMLTLTYHEK